MNTCVLCNRKFNGDGNDPHPLKLAGRCCDRCDNTKVTPARLERQGIPAEEAKVIGQNIWASVKFARKRMKDTKQLIKKLTR